jgi:hypothetical protein
MALATELADHGRLKGDTNVLMEAMLKALNVSTPYPPVVDAVWGAVLAPAHPIDERRMHSLP